MKFLVKRNVMIGLCVVSLLGILSACGTGNTVAKNQPSKNDAELVEKGDKIQPAGLKIISAKYGNSDIREVLEQKYRLGPNLYYGKMQGPPRGEKGKVWTICYSLNGEKRTIKGRQGRQFIISDEMKVENAFKLLKVLAGNVDLTEKFRNAIAGDKSHLKTAKLTANTKDSKNIILLCNDATGQPTIREYRKNQSIPLSPFRPRKPSVFYVSKAANANDINSGSKETPWKTLKRATSFLLPGDKLIVMPGIWRESLLLRCSGLPGKPISYSGTKGKTILRGDIDLRNWQRDKNDSRVWHQKHNISFVPYYAPNKYTNQQNLRAPIDVTVDGKPLFWNKSPELESGCFYVDRKKKTIYIRLADDTDPNQHKIEVISKFAGLDVLRRDDSICPPKFSHYAISNFAIKRFFFGANLFGKDVTFSDNLVEWCPREGLRTRYASNHIYKNNMFRWMGTVCAAFPGRSYIENNKMLFGNRHLHSSGWHSAGMKILGLKSAHSTFKNNEMAYTSALGFWFDTWVSGCQVDGNIIHDNFHAGMEEEISLGNSWTNNISFRNRYGLAVHNGNNSVYENNIFFDNYKAGIEWFFAHVGDRKGTPTYIPLELEKSRKRYALDTDPDYKKDSASILKYYMPAKNSDNIVKRNLLINNGRTELLITEDWRYRHTGKIVEPIPELVGNNKFLENVFIASSSQQAVSGFSSVNDWEKHNPNAENNVFSKSINGDNIPEWARKRFADAKDYLDYPRRLNSNAVAKIRSELQIIKPMYNCFKYGQSPAGLLAIARICDSPLLQAKNFSDPMVKGYFIKYKGKRTLVLWRKQGRISDMSPVLLKNLPENMKLETAWGAKLDIPRKGLLASVMVGTWPIYLVNCPENIEEQSPFILNYAKAGKTITVSLKNGIGNGSLIIDDTDNACLKCPSSLTMINGKAEFKLVFDPKPEIASVRLRIAGYLDGLYCGGFFKLPTRKGGEKKISLDKIKMLELKGNCDFSNILGGKIGSLSAMPNKINLHNGVLELGKTCVGFQTNRIKNGEKRPKSISLDLQNRKVKKIVLALVGAWTGEKTGAPLLAMNLFLDDNNVSSIELRNNYEIRDWWNKPTENQQFLMKSSGTYQLWQGDCGQGHWVTVYAYIWENPSPDLAIRSMELKSLNPKTSIGLLGVGIE